MSLENLKSCQISNHSAFEEVRLGYFILSTSSELRSSDRFGEFLEVNPFLYFSTFYSSPTTICFSSVICSSSTACATSFLYFF